VEEARRNIAPLALRTPLVPFAVEAPAELYLKLENLQPIGSFKLRGASHAMALATPQELERGVWTASAGNMAQGVAWQARRLGIPCTVVAPDHAPATKIAAIERLGAQVIKVPFAEWFQILETRRHPGMEGFFIHPVSDRAVIEGNGTIGLEILEDLPDTDVVIAPYGGGGLSCGIASAVRALRPASRVYACEVEIAAAVRLLAERQRVIAEGAGAAPVAAALTGRAGGGKIVCVVSGGNLDSSRLVKILAGETPA